ncbi:MAG: DUF167 domain-containing protein [Candidatus Nomurabacteria bacterium]|nr:DUF167 domain-containing protein [Candidatus Nomurabacteria bacterium]USN87988.1 MAG: DUF167 domain-containing protein [Candidatus Nomurabacteria bacterium]
MYVKVRVTPKAKKETVEKTGELVYEMAVKAPAERNLANQRVRELLAENLGVSVKAVRIVSGHHSGNKIFDVKM